MSNNLAAFNVEVFSKQLIINLDKINVMLPLVNRDWEGELKNLGDTVHVRTLGSITMNPYSKGSAINYEDLAPATEPMVVSDAEYFAFKVDDVDLAQNDIVVLDKYAARAAVSINDKVEAKLLSNYGAALPANRITNASAAAIALTKDNIYSTIVSARIALNKQNVPSTGRWMVIDPDSEGLLLNSDQFVKNSTMTGVMATQEGTLNGQGAGTLRPGLIGRIAGFDVYMSNAVPTVAGAKYLQFGDKYAIAYVAQLNEVETMRLQTTFANACRGLLLHDTHVFTEAAKRLGYIKAIA